MATVKVRQHKCPECSATLSIPNGASEVRCAYCNTPLSIENKKPPRDPTMTAPRTVYVPPSSGAGLAITITFLTTLIPLFFVGRQFWPDIRSLLPYFGNQLPTECSVNGRVTISGKQFTGKGTLITAGVNCTVVIKDSRLEGDTIVDGSVNVEVEVHNSTLIAKKRAIVALVNPKIRIDAGSVVQGDKVALELGSNGDIKLDGATLRSAGTAIKADGNLQLEADASEISGAIAIDAPGARRIDLDPKTKISGTQRTKR